MLVSERADDCALGYIISSYLFKINHFSSILNFDEVESDMLHLKVVVDQSSIELFTGDGIRVITLSVFPPPGTNRELVSI